MTIYRVKNGDTMYSIAQMFGVEPERLIQENGLPNNDNLAIGQTVVITYPNEPKFGAFAVNGYTYPYIDKELLNNTLPYLSTLTTFTYGFTENGEIIQEEDNELISAAYAQNVAPVLLISTLGENGQFSNELASTLLNNVDLQYTLIGNLLNVMREKGYLGLDIDFEYIYPEDASAYVDFVRRTTQIMNENGFFVIVALAPKISDDQPGLLYQGHDYAGLGEAANLVLIMTYEWGYTYGPPMAVAPINKVREVVDYAVSRISPSKILMGIPNYGYDFTLPYIRGTSKARSLGTNDAWILAADTGSIIEYDYVAQSPHFSYTENQIEHQVWFEDAASIEAKLALADEYGLFGVSYWNLMRPFAQNWLVLNTQYDIRKFI